MKDGVFNKKQTLKYTRGYANEAPASLVTEVATPESPTNFNISAVQRAESPARSASPSSPMPKWVELDKKVSRENKWLFCGSVSQVQAPCTCLESACKQHSRTRSTSSSGRSKRNSSSGRSTSGVVVLEDS